MGDQEDVNSSNPVDCPSLITEPISDLCLFVANLPASFTDEELEHHLRSLLGRHGEIISTKASRDKKQRPFCFVQFQGNVDNEIFTQPLYLGGRCLRLERSRVKSTEIGRHSPPLYIPPVLQVSGLRPDTLRRHLFSRFKRFGYILAIDLQWRGERVAFIYYENGEAVERALRANDGQGWMGMTLRCNAAMEGIGGGFGWLNQSGWDNDAWYGDQMLYPPPPGPQGQEFLDDSSSFKF